MKCSGLSLIELLIVICLSSFTIEGLFSVYLQAKEHHRYNNALQEITEESRFINQLFNRAFYGAGYLGLRNWNAISVYDAIHQNVISAAILLWNNEDSNLPENVKKKIKPNTQAIELKQMDFNVTSLVEPTNLGIQEIKVENNTSLNLKEEDYVLIADYKHAEINYVKEIKKLSNQILLIQVGIPLHNEYEKGAYLSAYLDKIYFVGDTGEQFSNKEPIYGLYMYSENGMTEEITELVSDIHFQWLKNKTLQVFITLSTPYLINNKIFEKNEEFVIANRQ